MRKVSQGCSRRALEYWLEVRGQSISALESRLGVGHNTLSNFLLGKSNNLRTDILQHAATLLNLPTMALLNELNPSDSQSGIIRSAVIPEEDKATMAEYAALCETATDHWTVHHSLNSYLCHFDHFMHDEVALLEKQYRRAVPQSQDSAYIERARHHYSLMSKAQGAPSSPRPRARAVHRIVTQQAAFGRIDDVEWLNTPLDRLRDWGLRPDSDRVVLSLLPPRKFQQLEQLVAEILGSPEWVAINIIDRRYSLIQIGAHTHACYHEGTVRRLHERLSAVVERVDLFPYFSKDAPIRRLRAEINGRSARFFESLRAEWLQSGRFKRTRA